MYVGTPELLEVQLCLRLFRNLSPKNCGGQSIKGRDEQVACGCAADQQVGSDQQERPNGGDGEYDSQQAQPPGAGAVMAAVSVSGRCRRIHVLTLLGRRYTESFVFVQQPVPRVGLQGVKKSPLERVTPRPPRSVRLVTNHKFLCVDWTKLGKSPSCG